MSGPDEVPDRVWWCFTCRCGVGVWGLDSPVPPPRCPACHESNMAPAKFVPQEVKSREETMPAGSRVHSLKTWPGYYGAVRDGSKPFEVRRNDREFRVGDSLWLMEFDPDAGELTGEALLRRVTYVLEGAAFGIADGFVVMGLAE